MRKCWIAIAALLITATLLPAQNPAPPEGFRRGLVAHYFRDPANWNGKWPDDQSTPNAEAVDWTFTNYEYSRVEPLVNHLFVNQGWFSIRWVGYIYPTAQSHTVDGKINLNPNNNPHNEFTLGLPDGTVITRDDLDKNFAGYKGPALTIHIKPKGNGNQNALTVDGATYPVVNANTYDIQSDKMTVDLYNAKAQDKGKGEWWLAIAAQDASILCSGNEGQVKGASDEANDPEYHFEILADDGCRLFIDDKKLIDDWDACWEQSPRALRKAGPIRLAPGPHRIVVEYFQGQSLLSNSDADPIVMRWSCPTRKMKTGVVPPSAFLHKVEQLQSSRR